MEVDGSLPLQKEVVSDNGDEIVASTSEGYSTSSSLSAKDISARVKPQPPALGPLVISISPQLVPGGPTSSSTTHPPRPSPLNNLPRCDFCLQTSAKSDRAVEQLLYCRDCQAKGWLCLG